MNKFKNLLALGEFNMHDESNRQLALSAALKCAGSNSLYFKEIKMVNFLKISDMAPKD